MNGADILSGDSAELAQMVRDSLLAQAAEAREDPAVFFDFVMRGLTDNRRIQLAAHQRVILEFILAHDRCVIMAPVGSSKTFITVGLTLFFLGQDPTHRGGIVSAAQGIAAKTLGLVRGYIDSSVALKLVFPELRRSVRSGDPWTDNAITVHRPVGIKDASLTAYGIESEQVQGSRLKWLIIDDVLNEMNTHTAEAREKTQTTLQNQFLSRIDRRGGKVVFVNTPWHPDDAVHRVEAQGWATLRMDVYGDIVVRDDVMREERARILGVGYEPWDSEHLRPTDANPANPACRLVAHDPDPKNEAPLWPEEMDAAWIEAKRISMSANPVSFNQQYRCQCRDDQSSMCKSEYIETSLRKARELGVHALVHTYAGQNLVFTGVDLAISPGEEHDDTVFFTFEARPGGVNVLLDLQVFQSNGPEILDRLFDTQRRYNSVVRVESNAAQMYIKQFALQRDMSFPIYPHTTGRAKAHPEHGVPGFFGEMMNGAWAFPNSRHGEMHPVIKRLCDACLYYTPSNHTSDILMAAYMAREQKRAWMGLGGKAAGAGATAGGIASNALSR